MIIKRIKSDHGREFKNFKFFELYDNQGISHEFLNTRKHRTLSNISRTILIEIIYFKFFCAELVNMTCHIMNMIMIRPIVNKTFKLF